MLNILNTIHIECSVQQKNDTLRRQTLVQVTYKNIFLTTYSIDSFCITKTKQLKFYMKVIAVNVVTLKL